MADNTKYKNMTLGFYISGQDDQQININTSQYFEKARSHYEKVVLAKETPWVEGIGDGREVKLSTIMKDAKTGVFNGVISKKRTEALPYLGSSKDHSDRKIDLQEYEDVWERSYFSYFPNDDILVFQENIIGPKVSDLEYILFKRCADLDKGFTFEAIWKSSAIKQLLNGKSTFKKVELSIALPRKFNLEDFDIDDPWTEEMLGMMNNTGMSRLNLVFFGRASQTRGGVGYIKETIGLSIKKMMDSFGQAKNTPILNKAKLLPSGGDTKEINLLDEKLREKIRLACNNGYENEDDVFTKIHFAKESNKDELKTYRVNAA